MTTPYLTLERVSYLLPDGSPLFSALDETFDKRPTGLVGRNGAGKTVLARILAGQLSPSSGRCLRSGNVFYLAQQVSPPAGATVASLAGVQAVLDALGRIEAGSSAPEDFEHVGDRWDIRQRLQHALARDGLGHLDVSTPASALSGGQAMRVALASAMLSDADFLILDEPSNHLDRRNRQALIEQLRHWPRGLLVVSHDRQLLDTMTRIVELSSLGLRSYGGNYDAYAASKAQERSNALERLEHRKLERRREEQAMQAQRERQERRQARGQRHGKEANQAKILLDRQKGRSEDSAGRLRQQHAAAHDRLAQAVRDAAQQVERDVDISLHALPVSPAAQRRAWRRWRPSHCLLSRAPPATSTCCWAASNASRSPAPMVAANRPCSRCWPANWRRWRANASACPNASISTSAWPAWPRTDPCSNNCKPSTQP